MQNQENAPQLAKTLSPLMIWGLGVGYVISGEYFGWNLGLEHGGPYGMLVATLLVTVMYVAFVLSYAELACALPRAGGAFVYAQRAFGPRLGLVAGTAQWIEFVFAPTRNRLCNRLLLFQFHQRPTTFSTRHRSLSDFHRSQHVGS